MCGGQHFIIVCMQTKITDIILHNKLLKNSFDGKSNEKNWLKRGLI